MLSERKHKHKRRPIPQAAIDGIAYSGMGRRSSRLHRCWPMRTSGRVRDELYESWKTINTALDKGVRGLPGGDSLARLLDRKRGVRNKQALPHLTERQIVAWAKEHRRLIGKWPTKEAGPIAGTHMAKSGRTSPQIWCTGSADCEAAIPWLGSCLPTTRVRSYAAPPPLSVETDPSRGPMPSTCLTAAGRR